MKKARIALLSILIFTKSIVAAQSLMFTKEQLISDLDFLRTALESKHPNLDTYSSEEEIANWFVAQKSILGEKITAKRAFKIVSSISSLIQDGHSYIYPSAQHMDSFFNFAPLFPLDLFLANGKLTVVGNHSREQNISLGATLIKINGIETEKIQSEIVQHTCRDGDNLGYPIHLYFKFFPAYYSYFYGFPEDFEIYFLNKMVC